MTETGFQEGLRTMHTIKTDANQNERLWIQEVESAEFQMKSIKILFSQFFSEQQA